MSYGVRVDTFTTETWIVGMGGGLLQNVVHTVARESLAPCAGKRKWGRGTLQFAKPCLQDLSGLGPQGDIALLSSLAE